VASRYLRFQLRGAAEPSRAPLLERLLARAEQAAAAADWRADAFRIIAPQAPLPSVAAVAYRVARGPRQQGCVFVATPLHYLAELSNVRLADAGILSLDAAEAESLARDFNRDWRDSGAELWAASGRLFCGFDTPLEVTTHDPERMRGQHLEDFLPAGADARRLRSLMSEIEMWLFDHALNRARRQQAQLELSALWLWGGGAPLAALPAVQGTAAGADVLFDAYPPAAGRAADIMLVHAEPNAAEWAEMQARWLTPTLADLRRGRIERLELSAGERRFVIRRRWRRNFWRRAKPWWEYFE
jgi:hypothetical protein